MCIRWLHSIQACCAMSHDLKLGLLQVIARCPWDTQNHRKHHARWWRNTYRKSRWWGGVGGGYGMNETDLQVFICFVIYCTQNTVITYQHHRCWEFDWVQYSLYCFQGLSRLVQCLFLSQTGTLLTGRSKIEWQIKKIISVSTGRSSFWPRREMLP